MSTLPRPSPEWFAARQPFTETFFKGVGPYWQAHLAGRITHEQYRFAILPESIAYCNDISPIWNAHGGKPQRKRNLADELQKHWGKTREDLDALRARALQ